MPIFIQSKGFEHLPVSYTHRFAGKTGCTREDIELLKILIPRAYELNRSAIRPDVRIRHAWYIEHLNALGSCPDYMLLEALTPTRTGNAGDPSTSWWDYNDKTALPEDLMRKVASAVDLMQL